jgi:hypothetical protein
MSPSARTGEVRSTLSPCPSWPYVLSPQQCSVPALRMAQVCASPVATLLVRMV